MKELKDVATCELVRELETREGVNSLIINPDESVDDRLKDLKPETGPMILLAVID